jgi:YidC/Oxa1 family membrane protein insertase
VIFVRTFPAGLIVYWITTNLWTVAQGYILRKRMGPIGAPKGVPVLAGIPGPAADGRGGGFMARLAAATGAGRDATADEPEPPRGAKAPAAKRVPAAAGAKPAAAGASKSGRAAGSSSKSSGTSAVKPAAKPARSGPPPPSPRKKKKRSGRRR